MNIERLWPELSQTLTMILAGGQGERLYPLTKDRAKPAVPFLGTHRIIDFCLNNCILSGIQRVMVLTQYKSLSLDDHIETVWIPLFRRRLGEYLRLIPPQQRLSNRWYLGTADAVYQNIYSLENERPKYTMVLGGDHVYNMDYRQFLLHHIETGAEATVGCIEVERTKASSFGVMEVDRSTKVLDFEEKPAHPKPTPWDEGRCLVSMGIYIFNTETLVREVSRDAKRDSSHDFGRDIMPVLARQGVLYAYNFKDREGRPKYWKDVGKLDDYYQTQMEFLGPAPPFDMGDPAWPVLTYNPNCAPCRLSSGRGGEALEVVDSLVANSCLIRGASVKRSILGPNVQVEEGAQVRESILMPGVRVGPGARVYRSIVDKGNCVPAQARIGLDEERDCRLFTITPGKVVVIPKKMLTKNIL